MKHLIIAIFTWLSAATVFAADADSATNSAPAIDNEYFRVLKNSIGNAESNANIGTRVIVALTNLVIQSERGGTNLLRGQFAVFHAGEKFQMVGGEFFEVAFKKNHPPLKPPEKWIEPGKNTLVYQDDEFRIFEERLEPGGIRELHSHAQRVVVRLNTVQLTDPRFHETARGNSGLQVANTVKYAEPVVHAVKNLSNESLFNIVIEYKVPHR